mmetsp:Transcript_23829/g.49580  ORF Transcript_23829/g.49580 Transcript_23829/m.49580 type:complete len:239 (-) Transcript_23829:791-1507(-)
MVPATPPPGSSGCLIPTLFELARPRWSVALDGIPYVLESSSGRERRSFIPEEWKCRCCCCCLVLDDCVKVVLGLATSEGASSTPGGGMGAVVPSSLSGWPPAFSGRPTTAGSTKAASLPSPLFAGGESDRSGLNLSALEMSLRWASSSLSKARTLSFSRPPISCPSPPSTRPAISSPWSPASPEASSMFPFLPRLPLSLAPRSLLQSESTSATVSLLASLLIWESFSVSWAIRYEISP